MTDAFTNPHLAAWDAQLAAAASFARTATLPLPASTRSRRPSWGGWSVEEIFEHLCVTDGLYEAPLRALIAAERARPEPRLSNAWRPTIWGRLLAWSLNPANTRKSKSPPAFTPSAAPRPQVVDAWLSQVERTRMLMREADGLDVRCLKLSSPAARIIRLNVGDAFAALVIHADRHMGQVRRTIADVTGSPASS